MSRVRAPANLPELVRVAFAKARSEGDLHYFPTQVTVLQVNNLPFQLRFSPSLANKPKGPPKESPAQSHKPFDPFAYPPGALFVTDVGPAHFLVLNKFAVIPEHFILATRDFKQQTHVLEASDLESTLACIEAYEASKAGSAEDGLFAFFNCGENSGASQPHRHIQLLPVSRMKDGLDGNSSWDVLAERLHVDKAPFLAFTERINLEMPAADLHAAYLRLYRQAYLAVAAHTHTEATPNGETSGPVELGESRISYNMAMTKDTLVVCPRLAEGTTILSADSSEPIGSLSLNGTVLAGTALVKSEAEWKALKSDSSGLYKALRRIGIPTDETHDEVLKL